SESRACSVSNRINTDGEHTGTTWCCQEPGTADRSGTLPLGVGRAARHDPLLLSPTSQVCQCFSTDQDRHRTEGFHHGPPPRRGRQSARGATSPPSPATTLPS